MRNMRIKFVTGIVLLFSIAGIGFASVAAPGLAASEAPTLPSGCGDLQVKAGNEVAFHAYATGVQVYKWNGSAWDFVAPVATLSADSNYSGDIGIHYAGPTWESKSGSFVKAKKMVECSPDPNAVPWLLLETVSTSGPGIFSSVTYVQRVNTTGGVRPAIDGTKVGETAEVPYTAEYYFYRAQD